MVDSSRPIGEGYMGEVIDNGEDHRKHIVVGIPMTGLVRSEWMVARYGQVLPTNWSMTQVMHWMGQISPLRFSVADARNLIASRAVEAKADWVFFIDHDVIMPPGTLLKMNQYMYSMEAPVVSGLYFTKCRPSEPLIYADRADSFARGWNMGDKVWAWACGLGCTIVHVSLLKVLYDRSESYHLRPSIPPVRMIFRSPAEQRYNIDTMMVDAVVGTEDIEFYDELQTTGVFEEAGWPEIQKKKRPVLVDTSIFCKHIDNAGKQYPLDGEEKAFMP